MAKYLLLYSVILPDFSTFNWSSSPGEGHHHPTLEHKKRAVEKINSGVLETSIDNKVVNLEYKNKEN